MTPSHVERQATYYTRTAAEYDAAHMKSGDEHFVALEYMLGLFNTLGVRSVLDVGCGTGRCVRFLMSRSADLHVVGVEPVEALRKKATNSGIGRYLAGTGESLPFSDGAFDAVIATGIMHHVPDPAAIVSEMTRTAKKAVMISDTNRFGSGRPSERIIKAVGFRLGLGRQLMLAKTRGKGYVEIEGDGLVYPYSVYDQLRQLASWADRLFLIPTNGAPPKGWLGPLLVSSHALLVAAREPKDVRNWAALGA